MTISAEVARKSKAGPPEGSLHHKLYLARIFMQPTPSQEDFGRMLKMSRSSVAIYESQLDRIPPLEYVQRVAELTKWPIAWFYDQRPGLPVMPTGYGSAPAGTPPAPSNRSHLEAEPGVGRRKFPLVGSASAASFPIASAERWPGDFVEFSDELYRPERFVIQIQGDSMSPRLEHGDYILVQPDTNPPAGLLAVFASEEHEYTVKVARKALTSSYEGQPINPDYPTILPDHGWRIVGYAVGRKVERGKGRYLEEGDNAGLRP